MKIMVVYESMFGNTKAIAESVAAGLREAGDVKVGTADELSLDEAHDADLIVAGCPTHARGLPRPNAHQSMAKEHFYDKYGPILPAQESLRSWLEHLPSSHAKAAAFDTRFHKPRWLTGSAAKKVARLLSKKGCALIGAQSFFIRTTGGPLADGERERAIAWGRELGAQLNTPLISYPMMSAPAS